MNDPKRVFLYRVKLQLQSEYRTNLVFQWFKCVPMGNVGLPNGPHPGLGPSAETRAQILLILATWTQFQHFKQLRNPPKSGVSPVLLGHQTGVRQHIIYAIQKKCHLSVLFRRSDPAGLIIVTWRCFPSKISCCGPVFKPCSKTVPKKP